jgi:uncharacterized protein (TIGR03086 family)
MDSLTRLRAGIDQARPIIAATTPDDYARPTPCEAWTVRELINHMLGALTMFRDVAVQGVADPAVFAQDLIGGDALASFDRAGVEAVAGWQADGRMDGTAKLPWGEFPAPFALQFPAMDMLVHGWDLAQATGQQHYWDDELVLDNLTFAQSTILASPQIRAGFYDPPIDLADDAPAIDRLIAFLGRHPA